MKLAVQIQLKPTKEQANALRDTLLQCNQACSYISKVGWDKEVLRQYDLHKLVYKDVREQFALTAQAAVRCIAKVADSYKTDDEVLHKFSKFAAQSYDHKIFRFMSDDMISIWTLSGRQKIPYICGIKQRELLKYRKGEIDLMFVRDKWYLSICCDIPDPDDIETLDVLGIDLGIVNLATDSNGVKYSGKAVEKQRRIMKHRRKNLLRNHSKAAMRKLRKLGRKQSRYQKDVNHCISKAIIQTAERYSCVIALEDLEGITKRVKVKRRQRNRLHNWGFYQLKSFITYKAKMRGLSVALIDPRNTSRQCPECGKIDKANRKTQAEFICIECGHAGHADHIAALNIRARAIVNLPLVVRDLQGRLAS